MGSLCKVLVGFLFGSPSEHLYLVFKVHIISHIVVLNVSGLNRLSVDRGSFYQQIALLLEVQSTDTSNVYAFRSVYKQVLEAICAIVLLFTDNAVRRSAGLDLLAVSIMCHEVDLSTGESR